MKKNLIFFILLNISFCYSFEIFAQSPSFPMNHWVYDYLDRLQSKKIINGFLPGIKPYTRIQIAQALVQLMKNSGLQGKLNSTEINQLEFLKLEFKEELLEFKIDVSKVQDTRSNYLRRKTILNKVMPDFILANNRNHFSFELDDFFIHGDFVLSLSSNPEHFTFKSDRTLNREQRGISLWGGWGNSIKYFFDFRDATEWGDSYPANNNWSFERVGFANAQGNKVSFDETNTGIFIGHSFWQVMIGKEKNRWGPGRFGALALSDWTTSYDQIKLYLKWSRIQFIAITGFMRTYPPIYQIENKTNTNHRSVLANKYLAAHRLEFSPTRNLVFGLHETIIYGERNLELAYLNPINFYWSAEHYLGDQDNSAIGMDFTWFPGYNLKFYGELFFDDFQSSKITSDWYGNKRAFLMGFSAFDVGGLSNLDFHFEWGRIRPYVYTHRFPINVYKQFTTVLGHWAGPNTETISLEIDYRFSKRLITQLGYNFYQHGANPIDRNVGGNLNEPWDIQQIENQKFLDGELERIKSYWLRISYELIRNLYIDMEFTYHDFSNVLGDSFSRFDGSGNEWKFSFSWNQ